MLVPTIRTICTDQELSKAFILAWQELFNSIPTKASIGVIVAQHNLETGGNNSWNWNLANVKYVSANGNVDYCALKGTWEIINGKRVELTSSDPGSWFRSFKTLKEGIVFYINFLNNKRYKNAWTAVESGNPAIFAHLLKISGFYTASEESYVRLINIYFNKFMKDNSFEKALIELQENSDVYITNDTGNNNSNSSIMGDNKPIFINPESTEKEFVEPITEPLIIKNNILESIGKFFSKFFN